MPRIANIISIEDFMKKILLSFLIIFVLFGLVFLGTNFFRGQLASLLSIITAWVTINPLEVKVSAPSEVEIDKIFKVEAKAINKGEEKIENAKAEIYLPSGLILLGKDSVQKIGVIPGKREKKVSWSVKGQEKGNYIVSVKVSGELRGEVIYTEDNAMIKIIQGILNRKWFQKFFDFVK